MAEYIKLEDAIEAFEWATPMCVKTSETAVILDLAVELSEMN